MIYILLLSLILLCMHMNTKNTITVQEDTDITTIPVVAYSTNEDSGFASYDSSPIPQIPYYTHKDIIGPPKAAVEINCPDCSGKWE